MQETQRSRMEPAIVERVSVLEVKVDNIDGKLDDIKGDVRDVHDCVHRTGEEIKAHMEKTTLASLEQHKELAKKISDLEQFKSKWTYLILGGLAVIGWVSGHYSALASYIK